MIRQVPVHIVGILVLIASVANIVGSQEIGTDLAGLTLCLYGDCEARGAYAADPYGWVNPGTLPVGTLPFLPRGAVLSGSYFRLNAGGVGGDVDAASATLTLDPWVFQVHAVYADLSGAPRSVPGVELTTHAPFVGLAAAVDLGRTPAQLTGLCVGLIAGVPGTESNVKLSTGGVKFLTSTEDRQVDLNLGLHWRGGEHDWFAVGSFLNAVRNRAVDNGLDPTTQQPFRSAGTANAWFSRFGVSLLPFVPTSLDAGEVLTGLLRGSRVGADLAYANISTPNESTRNTAVGYFGGDVPLIAEQWKPLSRYLQLSVIGGVDTDSGWGIGLGIFGNGPLQFLSCNPAYSSRPLAESLGARVDIWSANCAVAVPF